MAGNPDPRRSPLPFEDNLLEGGYNGVASVELKRQRAQLSDTLAGLDDRFLLSLQDDAADEKAFISAFIRVFQRNSLAVPVLLNWPNQGVEQVLKLIPILLPPPPSFSTTKTQAVPLNVKYTKHGHSTSAQKVMSGRLCRDDVLLNRRNGQREKVAKIFSLDGKPMDSLDGGDVGVVLHPDPGHALVVDD